MFSNPKGGRGGMLFLMQIEAASTFISMHYLLSQSMDFDQTCIVTLLGEVEELIRFL